MTDANPIRTPMTDPLTNTFGSLNDLAPDLATLQDLATRGSWRAVVDKISTARNNNSTTAILSQPHHHLTYLAYNVLALTKLRRFEEAAQELDSLEDLDSSTYRYESYPKTYSNRVGSMVPFCLRWLHALLPVKLGDRQLGLDRFYTLLVYVREKLTKKRAENLDLSVNCWRKREVFIINCLIGLHLNNKEFSVCLTLINELISLDALDPISISKLGYIQMQIGDLEGAKASFNRVENVVAAEEDAAVRNLVNRNKALMYLVVNLCSMYELAYVNHSDIKRTLSSWIAKVAPDDFDSSCTRI